MKKIITYILGCSFMMLMSINSYSQVVANFTCTGGEFSVCDGTCFDESAGWWQDGVCDGIYNCADYHFDGTDCGAGINFPFYSKNAWETILDPANCDYLRGGASPQIMNSLAGGDGAFVWWFAEAGSAEDSQASAFAALQAAAFTSNGQPANSGDCEWAQYNQYFWFRIDSGRTNPGSNNTTTYIDVGTDVYAQPLLTSHWVYLVQPDLSMFTYTITPGDCSGPPTIAQTGPCGLVFDENVTTAWSTNTGSCPTSATATWDYNWDIYINNASGHLIDASNGLTTTTSCNYFGNDSDSGASIDCTASLCVVATCDNCLEPACVTNPIGTDIGATDALWSSTDCWETSMSAENADFSPAIVLDTNAGQTETSCTEFLPGDIPDNFVGFDGCESRTDIGANGSLPGLADDGVSSIFTAYQNIGATCVALVPSSISTYGYPEFDNGDGTGIPGTTAGAYDITLPITVCAASTYDGSVTPDGPDTYNGHQIIGFGCTNITSLAAGTTGACDPGTNTYSQDIVVTLPSVPPGTPDNEININGQTFNITAIPQTVTLVGLTADGAAVDVDGYMTVSPSCTSINTGLFTAPASCAPTCDADNGTWN